MKILVCIKQVPDSDTIFKVTYPGGRVASEGKPKYWMNRGDESALEEALLIKEAMPETEVDAITIGPYQAAQVLERAMGMGVDTGVHILISEEDVPGPFTIASWISNYVSEKRYDLILCGVMAEDHMHGQVGPMLAELLDLPCATSVISERIDLERGIIYVEREIEGGQRAAVEMDLPVVLTFQTGANEPRYPTLSNLMRAKKQGALVIPSDTLPAVRDRDKIVGVDYPQKMRAGLFLEGNMEQKAALLLDILEKEALIS
jgi:electron transfer flavoprotein beta subunit